MDDSGDIILWPVMAYKMSQDWISDRLIEYYRLSVCFFFFVFLAMHCLKATYFLHMAWAKFPQA